MVEKLFRLLFKYPPLMFQQGDFAWGLSRPVLLAVAAAAAIAVLALLTYRGVSATERPRDRVGIERVDQGDHLGLIRRLLDDCDCAHSFSAATAAIASSRMSSAFA